MFQLIRRLRNYASNVYVTDTFTLKDLFDEIWRAYEGNTYAFKLLWRGFRKLFHIHLKNRKLDHLIEKATRLISEDSYSEAVVVCNQALELKVPDFRPFFLKGEAHFKLNEYTDCIKAYSEALVINPKHCDSLRGQAAAVSLPGNRKTAISLYSRVLTLDRRDYKSLYLQGVAYAYFRKYSKATDNFRRAVSIKPDYCHALTGLGVELSRIECHEEALRQFEKSIQVDPTYHKALWNKSIVLRKLKRYEEALSACDKAILLEPLTPRYLLSKAAILYCLEHYDDAIKMYDQILGVPEYKKQCDFAAIFFSKGIALSMLGRRDEAIKLYNQSISIKPNARAYLSKGVDLYGMKLYSESVEAYRMAVSINPSTLAISRLQDAELKVMEMEVERLGKATLYKVGCGVRMCLEFLGGGSKS